MMHRDIDKARRWLQEEALYRGMMARFYELLGEGLPDIDSVLGDYKSDKDIAECYRQACAEFGLSVERADAMRVLVEMRPI